MTNHLITNHEGGRERDFLFFLLFFSYLIPLFFLPETSSLYSFFFLIRSFFFTFFCVILFHSSISVFFSWEQFDSLRQSFLPLFFPPPKETVKHVQSQRWWWWRCPWRSKSLTFLSLFFSLVLCSCLSFDLTSFFARFILHLVVIFVVKCQSSSWRIWWERETFFFDWQWMSS